MTPKGKKGLKEIWKRDEEDPNVINLTNQNGEIDDEVAILDGILTARIHPHRLHPSELVEGKDYFNTKKLIRFLPPECTRLVTLTRVILTLK